MFRIIKVFSLLVLFLFTGINAQDEKSLSVTVYNNNLGVVKEVRELNVNKGFSDISITDVAQHIDATSVHIKFNGTVLEQNYQYDLVSVDKILKKYIDKQIQLISDKGDLIEGKLLSSYGGQLVLEKKDGGLLMLSGIGKYQISVGSLPDGLITKPTLIWKVNSEQSGKQDVEISYQTRGMAWHAEYVAVLNDDDTKTDLKAWVSIENNSGKKFRNAKLKLVAGDVNLVTAPRRPDYAYNDGLRMAKSEMAGVSFEEKDFFEYHIYNLQRKTTLANNETKQISLFESSDVNVEKKYFFKSNNYGNKNKVSVIVQFKNKKDNNLGVPMPKGKVRVYKSDGDDIEFIGEDWIDHTPKNEEVKLKIGDAFDVLAGEVQKDHKRISNHVYEQEFEITVTNRKDEDVVVEVEKYVGINWEVLSTSLKYDKKNAKNLTFKVPVKKDSKTVLKFRLRYTH